LELTDTGVSDYDQHCREIQSVVCDTSISVDHTLQALKNYPTSIRDKTEALFGILVKTGKVACAVVIPTTATRTCMSRKPDPAAAAFTLA
jgi:hypothetical protein